jgi:hypothetical protein
MRIRGLRNVGPLLRVPFASSLGGFYRRRARMFLPSVNGPRLRCSGPETAAVDHASWQRVAPAPEVGVVDATIADRPRQRAHAGSLPFSVSVAIRLCQEGHKVALASPALFCVATNPTPEDAGLRLSERSCGQHERKHRRPRRFSRCAAQQRQSRRPHAAPYSRSANGARHTGEIIAKAALGEGGLDPPVKRAVSRRTRPFPEPAPRRGWLAEREAEAPLLSDLQTSPSEAQCARREIPMRRGVCAARFC